MADGEDHLRRVRRICKSMPGVTEKLSHGAPTFFANGDTGVFTMFANSHHNDGRIAVWVPAAPGFQAALVAATPKTYFRPPYVGVKGWIGIALDEIDDEELSAHIVEAWEFAASKGKKKRSRRLDVD